MCFYHMWFISCSSLQQYSFVHCTLSDPQIRCVAANIPWQPSNLPCLGIFSTVWVKVLSIASLLLGSLSWAILVECHLSLLWLVTFEFFAILHQPKIDSYAAQRTQFAIPYLYRGTVSRRSCMKSSTSRTRSEYGISLQNLSLGDSLKAHHCTRLGLPLDSFPLYIVYLVPLSPLLERCLLASFRTAHAFNTSEMMDIGE